MNSTLEIATKETEELTLTTDLASLKDILAIVEGLDPPRGLAVLAPGLLVVLDPEGDPGPPGEVEFPELPPGPGNVLFNPPGPAAAPGPPGAPPGAPDAPGPDGPPGPPLGELPGGPPAPPDAPGLLPGAPPTPPGPPGPPLAPAGPSGEDGEPAPDGANPGIVDPGGAPPPDGGIPPAEGDEAPPGPEIWAFTKLRETMEVKAT